MTYCQYFSGSSHSSTIPPPWLCHWSPSFSRWHNHINSDWLLLQCLLTHSSSKASCHLWYSWTLSQLCILVLGCLRTLFLTETPNSCPKSGLLSCINVNVNVNLTSGCQPQSNGQTESLNQEVTCFSGCTATKTSLIGADIYFRLNTLRTLSEKPPLALPLFSVC